jgi:hypothetical protein
MVECECVRMVRGGVEPADLPLSSWKQPSANLQFSSFHITPDLQRQVVEGFNRTCPGCHGGTIFGPPVGPIGTRITALDQLLFDTSNRLASNAAEA